MYLFNLVRHQHVTLVVNSAAVSTKFKQSLSRTWHLLTLLIRVMTRQGLHLELTQLQGSLPCRSVYPTVHHLISTISMWQLKNPTVTSWQPLRYVLSMMGCVSVIQLFVPLVEHVCCNSFYTCCQCLFFTNGSYHLAPSVNWRPAFNSGWHLIA